MTSKILGASINSTNYSVATQQILAWSVEKKKCLILAANVHMLMEAYDSPEFMEVVNQADLVTPDGMPLVWMLRLKGYPNQERVYGPTLMLYILGAAARENITVGFYGSSPEVLRSLIVRMQDRFPNLKIAYSVSPPFLEISQSEDAEIVKQINASSVRILFVGLGCPKQEKWMADHRGKVNAVMIGVGAAFDFHAGIKSQAPAWMQKLGMEWLFRLITEPRRLWKRYLYNNPRFVFLAILDLVNYFRRVK